MNAENVLSIPKIENGIVIDHITAGLGSEILRIMRFHSELKETPITLGMNFLSNRLGKKDLVKLQIDDLPPKFLQHLSLIAPGVTIKRIKNFIVEGKIILEPAEIIDDFLKCPNPACITNFEKYFRTCFNCVDKTPMKFKCNYCERTFLLDEFEPFFQLSDRLIKQIE